MTPIIEAVIETKNIMLSNYSYVKYLNYPDCFNQWVRSKDLANMKKTQTLANQLTKKCKISTNRKGCKNIGSRASTQLGEDEFTLPAKFKIENSLGDKSKIPELEFYSYKPKQRLKKMLGVLDENTCDKMYDSKSELIGKRVRNSRKQSDILHSPAITTDTQIENKRIKRHQMHNQSLNDMCVYKIRPQLKICSLRITPNKELRF